MLNFIDFEVFKYDWLCVIANPFNKSEEVILNSREELLDYYEKHKSEIFIGYNIRGYDQWIFKGILCDINPKLINDWIIVSGNNGYSYSALLNKFPLIIYDTMDKMRSLKQLEGFMGYDIRETGVPFDINRALTPKEIEETIFYCRHDVEQTIKVFSELKDKFNSHMSLIKEFGLPISDLGKTQAQLSAKILGAKYQIRDDEWDISFVDTIRLNKYAYVKTWFKNNKYDYSKSFSTMVCGIPHTFGWGGLHGSPDKPIYAEGNILHIDVNSFYPSIMIRYDLLSRSALAKDKYKEIYDKRLKLKAEGKKKEQAPLKIVLNSTYGICKDKYNPMYDPRRANEVCINGQLLLLDLLEHLEEHCKVIQSNTDGLIIQGDYDEIVPICKEWEERTGMGLGYDKIKRIFQKDVNNYVFEFENGKIERKGAYVKELNPLDNDLAIVNTALVNRMLYNTPIEKTILECNSLIDFQKIVRVSSKYKMANHNGEWMSNKTYRVFASTNNDDGAIYKSKDGIKLEKFANTPLHCFIRNDDIRSADIDERLDKKYYINLAYDRLRDFGY